jgi:hypothetical protein
MTIDLRIGTFVLLVAACGGTVVVDGSAGSSSASSGNSSSGSSTSTAASSSSGGSGCAVSGCAPDQVCLFTTGQCAFACDSGSLTPCGPGLICVDCATGSCPGCKDCVAACLTAAPGTCDDHDDCAPGDVCLYGAGQCAPACSPVPPSCPTPDLVCNPCATSSCPGCDNCLGACTESF